MTKAPNQRLAEIAGALTAAFLTPTLSCQAMADEGRNIGTQSAEVISEKVAVDRVRIVTESFDGKAIEDTLTFLQISPKANPEYACLAVLDSGKIQDMDCFPIKTSFTPTMY